MCEITERKYGRVGEQDLVEFRFTNTSGMELAVINYGGTITRILVPDRKGRAEDVVLGFESLKDYELPSNPHFGSITGRFANRIAGGRFELDGKSYQLPLNNNGNTLHGGISGFDKKIWDASVLPDGRLRLSYLSEDGEEGFPGNCRVDVYYSLTDQNEVRLEYTATTDKATPFNITNHSYFNLSAGRDDTVLGHEIAINAEAYLPVDSGFIPVGELASLKDTEMDFRQQRLIGTYVHNIIGGGYDHNYVLDKTSPGQPELAANVYHGPSGRVLETFTTEPGMQFYTGNFLTGSITGKNGTVYGKHAGFCLEAQHFPDSPNRPAFPDTILRPGETYQQTTIYKFSTR